MMILLEDLKWAARALLHELGFSEAVANVIAVFALGILLNLLVLCVLESAHTSHLASCEKRWQRRVTQSQSEIIRTVTTYTLKAIRTEQRRICVAGRWVLNRYADVYCERDEIGRGGIRDGVAQ